MSKTSIMDFHPEAGLGFKHVPTPDQGDSQPRRGSPPFNTRRRTQAWLWEMCRMHFQKSIRLGTTCEARNIRTYGQLFPNSYL